MQKTASENEFYLPVTGLPDTSLFVPKENSAKKLNVIKKIEDALEDFDKDDSETASTEYVIWGAETAQVTLPPIPIDREAISYLLRNALLLIDAGEYALSRNLLCDILNRDPHQVEAMRWLGWCYKNEGQLPQALECYRRLAKKRVTEQDLFELGEIYFLMSQETQAFDVWMDALGQCSAESPRLFDLHKGLGNVSMRMGDYDGAEENYNKALTLRPHSDILHVNIGVLQFHRKNFNLALDHFKQAIEQNHFNERAWCGVALVAKEKDDREWAAATLQRALEINPENPTTLEILKDWIEKDPRIFQTAPEVRNYLSKSQEEIHGT